MAILYLVKDGVVLIETGLDVFQAVRVFLLVLDFLFDVVRIFRHRTKSWNLRFKIHNYLLILIIFFK